MNKLLLRGFLFLLIGFFLVHILASVAKQYAPDGTSVFFEIDRMRFENVMKNRQNVQAIVLGNSHGDNISFEALGIDGYSLARAWGDFFETQYYVNYLLPRLPNLEIVFIPISYFSFSWDNGSVTKLEDRRAQIYQTLPAWNFISGDIDIFFEGKIDNLFPIKTIVREDHWKGVFYTAVAGKNVSSINNILVETCDYPDETLLGEIAKKRVIDTVTMGKEIFTKQPDIHSNTYLTLAETIKYLQSNGVRVILFTPPYYEDYTTKYFMENPGDINQMRQLMAKLLQEYGVEYYDFSDDKNFVDDISLYKDSDHLNLCGKNKFSKDLYQKMYEHFSAKGLP
jgi:hypothetical protein